MNTDRIIADCQLPEHLEARVRAALGYLERKGQTYHSLAFERARVSRQTIRQDALACEKHGTLAPLAVSVIRQVDGIDALSAAQWAALHELACQNAGSGRRADIISDLARVVSSSTSREHGLVTREQRWSIRSVRALGRRRGVALSSDEAMAVIKRALRLRQSGGAPCGSNG